MIQELVNRIQALKKRVARLEDIIPESIETPDEGGVVIVRITGVHSDSPGDDDTPHVFQGDLYQDGTKNDATKTDVTVFIMDIAAGIESYPSSAQIGVPIGQTWTGASGDEHAEIVYEVAALYWWG